MSGRLSGRHLRFGHFEVDTESGELRSGGRRVPIQRQPFELLACLLERPGQTLRREDLYARLWPAGTFVDFEHGLNTVVRKLRAALADSPDEPEYVETVAGRGYRFVARVWPGESDPPRDTGVSEPALRSLALLARPPFVGRELEVGRLERRLTDAEQGRGGLVLVAGEPGIGKTRLLEELAARARRMGVSVLAGGCTQGEWAAPYGPFAEALVGWVHQADHAALLEVADAPTWAVLAKLVPLARAKLDDLPEPPPLRPDEERQRILDAVAQLALGMAKRRCVLLLLDDLHWADPATLTLLGQLARVARGAAFLIAASYRDVEVDRAHPLARTIEALSHDAGFEEISLAGLKVAPVSHWLARITGGSVAASLPEHVVRATNGNPFFLRELFLDWARDGRLEGEGGGTTAIVPAIGVPKTVRAMVERRLARLSDGAGRLLACASAFQGTFLFEAVWRTAGLTADAGLDALDEAHQAELVRSAGGPDDYDFVHALIRQALYESLTAARRVRIHRRLAEEMEREATAGGPARAAEIADQYHRSRALPGAEAGVRHAVAAADRADAAADFEGAARFLSMALDLLPAEDPRRARLLGRLAVAHACSGASEQAATLATEAAQAISASDGDPAELLADVADTIWRQSYHPIAAAVAEQGMLHAGDRRDRTWLRLAAHRVLSLEAANPDLPMLPADTPLRRQVFRGLLDILRQVPDGAVSDIFVFESRAEAIELAGDIPGAILFWIGDYRMGREAFRQRTRRAIADGRLTEAALASIAQSLAELALGELDAADASAAQAQACDRRAKPQVFTAVTIRMNAMMRARLRDYGVGETLAGLERRARPDSLGATFNGRKLAACIALYAAVGQRRDAALEALDRAMPAIDLAPAWADNYTLAVSHAAEALWTLGERRHLESVERSLREKVLTADFRFPNTDARLSLARLCALTGRYTEASDWFARARVVLDEQGARPLRAITDIDEAWMYLRRGARTDRARAAPLLDAAVAQFESIGMPGWVERAKTLLCGRGAT